MERGPLKYLLDTHVWIWWNAAPKKLSSRVRNLIASGREDLLLSAISPWEFCKLVEKGRYAIALDTLTWIETALDVPGLRLAALTPRIAHRSTVLPSFPHGDPADQIIAATAREEGATLLTKDGILLRYPHVKAVW